MLAGSSAVLKIDLNMLRGDKIRARRDFTKGGDMLPNLRAGMTVSAIDEEGDTYVAKVERVDGLRVFLHLVVGSRMPTEAAWSITNPYSGHKAAAHKETAAGNSA